MTNSLRLIATLKGSSVPSLDVTAEIDENSYRELAERLSQATSSAEAMAAEQARLRSMFDALAVKAGTTRADLLARYDFQIEVA